MKHIASLTTALLLCLGTQAVAGTSYHSTIASLNSALESAAPGDTFVLRKGTYDGAKIKIENNSQSSEYITLKAESGGETVFTGVTHIYVTGDYVRIRDFKFDRALNDGQIPIVELRNTNYEFYLQSFFLNLAIWYAPSFLDTC